MARDEFNRQWITDNALEILEEYNNNITIRALHYRLVSIGMPNTMQHYKRVVAAMTKARKEGVLEYDAFDDHERDTIGSTFYSETDIDSSLEYAFDEIKAWMSYFEEQVGKPTQVR